jgi:single-stranded-DNA-specific exonuclease
MFCSQQSVRGRGWALREARDGPAIDGVPPFVVGIAAARGIEDLEAYFAPKLDALPGPGSLIDLEPAVERFCRAVEAGETIGVIGDYDVDGASSTALLIRLARGLGHDRLVWRIPGRLADGYGPNDRLVDELCADNGATLLVVVDSGTAALGPLARARGIGADVVVLDHHEPGASLPEGLIVNPKRRDEDGSLAFLCAAGLTFVFAVAVARRMHAAGWFARKGIPQPEMASWLGLVALATIADIVPLVGLNRALVAKGLRRIPGTVGLRALMEVTGHAEADPFACGYLLGPCLNAAGRLAEMNDSVEILSTEDPVRAAELAKVLHALNQERRDVEKRAVEEAKRLAVETGQDREGTVIVLSNPDWHPGVVGLVAGKLREAFDKPAAVAGAGGKGSARSVDGFDFGGAIIAAAASGVLQKGGGHAMAAGFTVDEGRVDDLRDHLRAAASGFVAGPSWVDVVTAPGEALPGHVQAAQAMEPCGMGNTKPRIALVGGRVRRVQNIQGKHAKAFVSGPAGETAVMMFNGVGTRVGDAILGSLGKRADFLGTLDLNTYGGETTAFLKVEDVMVESVATLLASSAAA